MSLVATAERNPVTTILIVGAIAATLAEATGRSVGHMVLTPATALSEPWRFVTTIFPHAGPLHLLFNVFWTARLGVALEERMGSVRMLALALVSSVVAAACEVSLFNAGIGLSGAVYALAFYAWARGRHDPRYSGILSKQDLQLLIGWFGLCLIMTELNMMPVANAAHGGGAIMGFLLGTRRGWLAPAFVVLVGAVAFVRLRNVPTYSPEQVDLHTRAYDALRIEDYEYAVQAFERLFAAGGDDPVDRYNYGVSLHRLGRADEGDAAMLEVAREDPSVIPDDRLRAEFVRLLEESEGRR